jgi:hypothetical protein
MKTNRAFHKILLVCLICGLMAGCGQGEPRETVTAVNSPTAANTITASPQPTGTSLPTATPIRHVDLPGWVSDPAADILLIATGSYGDEPRDLILVNPLGLEAWSMPEFHSIEAYFWTPDGEQIGIITMDDKLLLIDTFTGDVEVFPGNDKVIRVGGNYAHSLVARSSPHHPEKWVLYPQWWSKSIISFDGLNYVEQDMGETDIIDVETGDRTPITRAEDGLDDYMVEWSPVGPELAVAQADKPSSMYYWFEEIPNISLKIYDADGRLVRKYENVTYPRWSPDGLKFLYQPLDAESHMFWASVPCVYDTLTNETRCFNDISVRHPADSYSGLQWLPSGDTFAYVYNKYDNQSSVFHGGLCFVTASTGYEKCLLQENSEGLNAIYYRLSSGGSYVSVFLSDTSPMSDDCSRMAFAVASVNTGKYFIVDEMSKSGPDDLGAWRPAPAR